MTVIFIWVDNWFFFIFKPWKTGSTLRMFNLGKFSVYSENAKHFLIRMHKFQEFDRISTPKPKRAKKPLKILCLKAFIPNFWSQILQFLPNVSRNSIKFRQSYQLWSFRSAATRIISTSFLINWWISESVNKIEGFLIAHGLHSMVHENFYFIQFYVFWSQRKYQEKNSISAYARRGKKDTLSTISRPLASNQIELKLNWKIFLYFLCFSNFFFSPLWTAYSALLRSFLTYYLF